MILLFRACSGIVEYAQNRAIRDRTQGPLPAVIIGRSAQRSHSNRVQQRIQGDIDVNAGAGLQADFFLQRRKK